MWEQSTLYAEFVFLILKIFLAVLHSMWDLKLPDQGSAPCPLHWKCVVLTTGQPGKSQIVLKNKNKSLSNTVKHILKIFPLRNIGEI